MYENLLKQLSISDFFSSNKHNSSRKKYMANDKKYILHCTYLIIVSVWSFAKKEAKSITTETATTITAY